LFIEQCIKVMSSSRNPIRKHDSGYQKRKKKQRIEKLTQSMKGSMDRFVQKESQVSSANQTLEQDPLSYCNVQVLQYFLKNYYNISIKSYIFCLKRGLILDFCTGPQIFPARPWRAGSREGARQGAQGVGHHRALDGETGSARIEESAAMGEQQQDKQRSEASSAGRDVQQGGAAELGSRGSWGDAVELRHGELTRRAGS
jgi:hypothetical protein